MQYWTRIFLLSLSCLIGIFCTGLCKKNSSPGNKWFASLHEKDANISIQLAKKITSPINKSDKISKIVKDLCLDNGIKPEYIFTDFNKWDYEYWQRALFLKSISDSLIKNFNKNDLNKIINTLFHAVYTRIKHTDLNKNENKLWPDAIWKNAQGMCDSEAWLLSELAYQQGFETMIIYLRNPKTGISPHTLCEIRKGKQVWICDPFFGSILSNISFGQLAVNAQLLDKFWPNKNLWHESMGKAEFWLPAYVQDYTQRNQLLAKAIYTQLNDKAPRFGEDPFKRFFKYIELMNSGSPNIDKKFSYGLWFFPFRLLGAEFNNQ